MAANLETPALNADGTLKDASEIPWFNSPSDTAPLNSAPAEPPASPTPQAATWRFMTPIIPSDLGRSSKKRPLTELDAGSGAKKKLGHTAADVTKRPPTAPKQQPQPSRKDKQKPPPAIARVKSLTSVDTIEENETEEEIERRKRRKRGDGSADVATVFISLNPDEDGREGWECIVCT
jgi:hypothetical protein